MAPELFTQSIYDPKMADVWSLGIMYACMVLKKFPWTAAHKQNADFSAYSGADLKLPALDSCPQNDITFQSPPVFIRQCPANTQSVIHSMLRVQPAKRSELAAIRQSISHNQNRQRGSTIRTSKEALRSLQIENKSNEYLSLNETYGAKPLWALSGETLYSVIEVTEV